MPTAEWPVVQLTVRIERDQIIGQTMTWKHALTFQGLLTTALSLTALWNACDGASLKQQRSSSFLPFPRLRRWLGGLGVMCLKRGMRGWFIPALPAVHLITWLFFENVMYSRSCGHFRKLAAGLPFSLRQQLGKCTSGHILMLFLCHHYSMKLLKVDYCAEWSCS